MEAHLLPHIIYSSQTLREALVKLNQLGEDLTLFILNEDDQLLGALTDGDVRRGLLEHKDIDAAVTAFMRPDFMALHQDQYTVKQLVEIRKNEIQTIPIIDDQKRIVKLINFSKLKSNLPIDVVIMAGGEGIRLRPLTDELPKPLLKVGNKPIIEHGLDRLIAFGVEHIHISINYLGEKIKSYFGNGSSKNVNIHYIEEHEKMGTIGSVSLVSQFKSKHILVINSDLLTNIDFEEFYLEFEAKDADMAVACLPFTINVPYAIIDTEEDKITGLKEKPNLNYYTNAGIYLIKTESLKFIPKNKHYNATDLIETLIAHKKKVVYYPLLGYWLDIGKMDDFNKAQEDIKHIKF